MIVNMPYPEYIEAMRRPEGMYRFILTRTHREKKEKKEYVYVDMKLSELPDDLRSRVNMLRMRPDNSYLEELGAISGNWMCVRVKQGELRQLQTLGTGHNADDADNNLN
jgi:hypothetical protein